MADTHLGAGIPRANAETAKLDSNRHSRRALLGAMAVAPLVALPAIAAPARDAWERARDAYLVAHDATNCPGLSDAEIAPLSERESALFAVMVGTPVPDLAALREKMEIGTANVWRWSDAEGQEVAALLADVRTLAGRA